ncbi:DUF3168 domain-containing protein [Rhodomicrobium lacus]|uniref:DUF3168 domain-containing protein n=1 Tax=Rhodomicrobium lacus TaxID=2498452 RepID=UPI000F8E5896|nr:DUF3168 domain-containing protein [Rhodomicrobium lacus]
MPARELEVHKALFDALTTALAPVAVYDDAPQDVPFPFVEFQAHQTLPHAPGAPLSGDFAQHTVWLGVWSSYRGKKEVLGIIASIREALHDKPLTLAAGAAVLCQITAEETRRDADGVTQMGAVTVRVLVQD